MRGKMRGGRMKKLLLIPLSGVTLLLALAFVLPGPAASSVGKLASDVHLSIGGFSSDQAASLQGGGAGQSGEIQQAGSQGSAQQAGAARAHLLSNDGLTARDQALLTAQSGGDPPVKHSQASRSHDNCGRFGNGLHGGKHLLICPNTPF